MSTSFSDIGVHTLTITLRDEPGIGLFTTYNLQVAITNTAPRFRLGMEPP